MAIAYTKQMFIERVRRHLANDFPNSSFSVSENEVLLYIDAAIPFVLRGQVFDNAKVTGVLDLPEAYLLTYEVTTLLQSDVTNEWYATLPQTPLALPDGYNITDAYFSRNGQGRSQSVFFVKTKRISYRENLPKPEGVFARLEGDKIYLQAKDGQMLYGETLFVQMPISRTADKNAVMNLPDDSIQPIFDNVVSRILLRWKEPQDIVKDDLAAGNKTS